MNKEETTHADLLAQKLPHLILCPWKAPGELLHTSIFFCFGKFQLATQYYTVLTVTPTG